jgi:hypothetical protein
MVNDDFTDDADDDNLSFDGIYDDEPPGYRAESSVADAQSTVCPASSMH